MLIQFMLTIVWDMGSNFTNEDTETELKQLRVTVNMFSSVHVSSYLTPEPMFSVTLLPFLDFYT